MLQPSLILTAPSGNKAAPTMNLDANVSGLILTVKATDGDVDMSEENPRMSSEGRAVVALK